MTLERLRAWMERDGVDAALVTDPTSIGYLTGFFANPHERLMALAVTPAGIRLLLPDLEREKAESATSGIELVPWQDGEDALAILRRHLGSPRRLGIEKDHLTFGRWEALDAGDVADCSAILRQMRAIKTSDELAKLQRAAAATDAVTEAALDRLRPDQTELEVAALLAGLINAQGCELSFAALVQSGPNSAMPHLPPGSRVLAAGDLVLLDFGAAHAGYKADTTRMAVVGEPTERQRAIHRAVLDAHDRAIEGIREGVTGGAIDAAARDSLVAGGYGDGFIHRTGHGLGLDAHEDPNLAPGSDLVLVAGNVVTVEPGVYIPGWGGVRIEDDVVVLEGGCRVLTEAGRGLKVIPT